MPLGMLLGFALFPLGSWLTNLSGKIALGCLILFVLIVVKRLTAGLANDLKTASDKKNILLNRLLYDRSYL